MDFKLSWLQDPVIGGASDPMKGYVPQVQANIRQHQVLQFQEQVQGLVQGQTQQAPDPKTIAAIQAQAAKEVMQANQALQAVTMGEDPMHMLARAELIKAQAEQQKVNDSKANDLGNLALEVQKLSVDLINAQAAAKKAGLEIQDKQFEQGLKLIQTAIDNTMRAKELQIQEKQANKPRTTS